MRDRRSLQPATLPDPSVRVEQVHDCPPSFWRFLYTEVGRAYHWVDRLPWTDDEIRAYLDGSGGVALGDDASPERPPATSSCGAIAPAAIEIAYFGLLPSSRAAASAGTC